MGSCFCLEGGNDEDSEVRKENVTELIKPLSTTEKEDEVVEIKMDNIDPWSYSNELSINEVQDMLENVTLDNCKPFVAPIKYAKVVKVYDGDTVTIVAPLFDGVISRFRVRLNGIDAPEIRTKDEWEKKAGYIVRDILNEKKAGYIVR